MLYHTHRFTLHQRQTFLTVQNNSLAKKWQNKRQRIIESQKNFELTNKNCIRNTVNSSYLLGSDECRYTIFEVIQNLWPQRLNSVDNLHWQRILMIPLKTVSLQLKLQKREYFLNLAEHFSNMKWQYFKSTYGKKKDIILTQRKEYSYCEKKIN